MTRALGTRLLTVKHSNTRNQQLIVPFFRTKATEVNTIAHLNNFSPVNQQHQVTRTQQSPTPTQQQQPPPPQQQQRIATIKIIDKQIVNKFMQKVKLIMKEKLDQTSLQHQKMLKHRFNRPSTKEMTRKTKQKLVMMQQDVVAPGKFLARTRTEVNLGRKLENLKAMSQIKDRLNQTSPNLEMEQKSEIETLPEILNLQTNLSNLTRMPTIMTSSPTHLQKHHPTTYQVSHRHRIGKTKISDLPMRRAFQPGTIRTQVGKDIQIFLKIRD